MNKLFSVAAFAFALAAKAEVYTVQTDEILPITDTTVGDSALDYDAHPELLDAKHYIIRMEGGELHGTFDPAWVSAITTAYPKWQVRQNPKGVYLTVPRGMTVIVR